MKLENNIHNLRTASQSSRLVLPPVSPKSPTTSLRRRTSPTPSSPPETPPWRPPSVDHSLPGRRTRPTRPPFPTQAYRPRASESVNERVGPTDDDGKLPPGGNTGDDRAGSGAEIRRRELPGGRVDISEEVVGDAVPLSDGDLVGARGDFDGEAGFSGAGAAHDDDDFVFPAVVGGGVHSRPAGSPGGRGRGKEKSD
ncbi:disease resistance protein [Senna tora]|uniref:Disease resistance protein n=1 Tax=Senna tora TaxID=362788 RepID=A0A834SUB6_9FABA|nr:disease resistance protein [Senna tora]